MDRDRQDIRYEELYNRLLERGMALHAGNKKRIRIGLIMLGVFTVLIVLIRLITDSDRVVFMIIWVIGMFIISIYLISIEYIDSSVQKTLAEAFDRETGFGELLPDSEQMYELVQNRIQERHEDLHGRLGHLRSEDVNSEDKEREDEQ